MRKTKNSPAHFIELLRSKNLRATPTRHAILEALARSDQPLTVEDIFGRIGKIGRRKEFDLATLYRTMKSFEVAGLVISIDLGTGKNFYEFKHEHSHHHHHVICQNCQHIEHLEVCGIEPHLKMLEQMGYKHLSHKLEFTGLCKDCA